jgi:ABC-type multidrug transport system fused ATPase/permease subunit
MLTVFLAATLFIECESFSDHGGWTLDPSSTGETGSSYLMAHGCGSPVKDASTEISLTRPGRYRVCVRTRNWADGAPGRFRVLVDGKDVKTYQPEVLRDKVGIVPQKAVLFSGSIRENIRWGKEDASDEEIWKALTAAQAKDFVEDKEGGLDFVVAQGGKNLSGGQKQRLTIARALVMQPEILILDDSASALDYATDAALRKSIKELDSDMTVFIVSQRTASVLHADKIIVLEDGEIAGVGTHAELLETCPVYKEIHDSQAVKGGQE